jgi:hypothetical protein
MSNATDALVYSTIQNNMTSTQWSKVGYTTPDFVVVEGTSTKPSILKDSVIKRAICNPKLENKVPVRIPLSPAIKTANNLKEDSMQVKYGYYDKEVIVPDSLKGLYPDYKMMTTNGKLHGNSNCDNFYKAYCANITEEFKQLVKDGKYDVDEFARYKPECACLTQPSDFLKSVYVGDAALQLSKTECWPGIVGDTCRNSAYRLPSNLAECQGSITVCQQNLNLTTGNIGGSASVSDLKFVNNCGATSGTTTNTNVGGATGTPANNTSGTPANNTSGTPANNTSGTPANNTGGTPANNTSGTPTNNTSGTPTNNTSGTPANNTSGTPTNNTSGTPTNTTPKPVTKQESEQSNTTGYILSGLSLCSCIIVIIFIIFLITRKK